MRLIVGRTPWSARVPRTRSSTTRPDSATREKADGGVGRGPGGPPHLRPSLALALVLAFAGLAAASAPASAILPVQWEHTARSAFETVKPPNAALWSEFGLEAAAT